MADEEKKETNEKEGKEKEGEKQEGVEEGKEEAVEEQVEKKSASVKTTVDEKEEKEVVKEEPKQEAKIEEKPQPKPEPTGKFKELVKQIENMSVLELSELVKVLEERFGVSAAVPMTVAGAPAVGEASAQAEEAEEKANYTIMLQSSGAQKIAVIKAIRIIRPDLGLKEAKDLVDGAPKEVKANVPKADAESAKKTLEEAGATVGLK